MKKPKKTDDLQAAIQAAWRLVETEGLKKEAFDRASTDCVNACASDGRPSGVTDLFDVPVSQTR